MKKNFKPLSSFLYTVKRFALVKKNEKILVACSGGPDSVSLLFNLLAIKKEFNLALSALYIDHGWREEAEKEKKFIKKLCEEWGIPFFYEKLNPCAHKWKGEKNTEQHAREKREKIYTIYTEKRNFDKVALGHNLNDVMETILFRIFRGGFGEKLPGILPERNFFIRPLILTTRDENLKFLKKYAIPYFTDITNWNTGFTRNWIRHEIIPRIQEEFPEWEKGFKKTLISFFEQRSFLEKEIEKQFKNALLFKAPSFFLLNKNILDNTHDYIKKEILSRACSFIFSHILPNFEQKEEFLKLLKQGNGRVCITKGVYAEVSSDYVSIFKEEPKSAFQPIPLTKKKILWPFLPAKIEIRKNKTKNTLFPLSDFYFNKALLRKREEGDFFQPQGGKRKKLKKFMIERKIPRFLRDRLPVLAIGKEILWIYREHKSEKLRDIKESKYFFEVKNVKDNSYF